MGSIWIQSLIYILLLMILILEMMSMKSKKKSNSGIKLAPLRYVRKYLLGNKYMCCLSDHDSSSSIRQKIKCP